MIPPVDSMTPPTKGLSMVIQSFARFHIDFLLLMSSAAIYSTLRRHPRGPLLRYTDNIPR